MGQMFRLLYHFYLKQITTDWLSLCKQKVWTAGGGAFRIPYKPI